eukprot:GFUD01112693.1.p1 GENE.GFUD01112693.1~~GFUD01112693.1.p1  ORF type:complete len:138 (+),score=10.08 GFUD01112693.1:33-416(+)
MYSYYALSAVGGRVKKFLWWKKYLTCLQMLQFVVALVMGTNAIIIGCNFPMWMQYSCCLYMVSFLVLFSDFYYKAYLDHRCKAATKAENGRVEAATCSNGDIPPHKNGVHSNGNGLVKSSNLEKKIN